uniref:Uncharacterized protein n=1 Tax=Oryzias sinensis TaxID=183150 RepID=A0A8C7YR07_9TELE
ILDIPTAEQHVDLLASPLQISPRTVTIQAEVHAISPDREDVKRVGKLASIFNQKRSSKSPVETSTSPHTDSGPKLSSPTVKLKSNVVLQEEDLELSVLESESTPKCSEAERKQFMAAFKQPGVDGPKSKPVKSQGKQKEAAEKTPNAADKTADGEDVIMQPTVEETQREKKEATKKRPKKGRIEATEKNEAANTSPAGPDVTDAAAAPPVPVMRRSRREAVIRQTSQSTPTTPVRKTRRQQASNEAVTPSISQESPLKLVPSKTRKSKYCVFVAEIISPPDTKQSPIRKQAKKLVEKAKQVIEQNKKSAVKQEPVRRSGRNKMTEPINWELLMESKRRGVDLLYSNLETLLPLPQTQMSISKPVRPELSNSLPRHHPFGPSPQQPSPVCDGPPPSASSVNQSNESDSSSPIKVSSRMKRNKKRLSSHNQDRLESESDSEDGFLSLRVKQTSTPTIEAEKEAVASAVVTRKPLTPEERIKSVPVSQCLQSVADFMDDMSYMDSWLYYSDGGNLCRRTPPGGAVVKDGMTDEPRFETETDTERWITESRTLEIQAAVEALSFHKCQESAADAWNKVQQLGGELEREATAEVTLPLAPHREGWTFTQESICQPQLVQQRSELMGSLMFGGVFGALGNRQAAALDYLPVIRTICRSEQLKEQGKVKRRSGIN